MRQHPPCASNARAEDLLHNVVRALLALDARVLCLDEPTAGLAQRETEAFGPLLLRIRRELDASLLVIEHDRLGELLLQLGQLLPQLSPFGLKALSLEPLSFESLSLSEALGLGLALGLDPFGLK